MVNVDKTVRISSNESPCKNEMTLNLHFSKANFKRTNQFNTIGALLSILFLLHFYVAEIIRLRYDQIPMILPEKILKIQILSYGHG